MGIQSTATANPVLTATFVNHMQNLASFVGRRIAPVFNSAEQAASYYVFDEENGFDIPDLEPRAPSSPYPRTKMLLSQDTFDCIDRGIELPVDDSERRKYESALSADMAAARRAANIVAVSHEKRVYTKATSVAVPTSSPSAKWNTYTGTPGDPLGDIDTAKETIYDACGMEANLLVLPRAVFNAVRHHPDVVDRFKYTAGGIITAQQLATLFNVREVVVPGALENTAADGQTISPSQIWGESVLLCVTNPSPDLEAPNFMRTFNWSAITGPSGALVESYREENVTSMIHRARTYSDEKITGASLAYHFSNTLA